MRKMSTVLSRFPKRRMPLPPAYAAIYEEHYLINRNGQSATTKLSQGMEGWLHRQVARDLDKQKRPVSTLELGAGTLNQLAYEPECGPYDVVEPFTKLYEGSKHLERIRDVFTDISEVRGRTYDRITSVAVFEHITDLPLVVARSATMLKPGGSLRAAIPNEGTILWWLGTCLTGMAFRKRYGLSYARLMEFEHVNTADDIGEVLECFFGSVKCRVRGLSKALAFYRFYEATLPRIEEAQRFIAAQPASRF